MPREIQDFLKQSELKGPCWPWVNFDPFPPSPFSYLTYPPSPPCPPSPLGPPPRPRLAHTAFSTSPLHPSALPSNPLHLPLLFPSLPLHWTPTPFLSPPPPHSPNSSLIMSHKMPPRVFLVVQWLRLCLPMQGVQVPSLVGELRSHMPPGQKTKT